MKLIALAIAVLCLGQPAQAQSRFDGAFAAVFGGYEIASRNQAPLPYYTQSFFPFVGLTQTSQPGFDNIAGARAGGSFGYNVTSGQLLVGFEGRGQYSFSNDRGGTSITFDGITLPSPYSSCSGCAPQSGVVTLVGTSLPLGPGTSRFTQTFSRPASGDFAFRAGVIWNEWLVFGRAGGGMELSKTVNDQDDRGVTLCVNPIVTYVATPTGFTSTITSCSSTTQGPRTVSTATRVTPIAVIGAGLERNFGQTFVRAEAEMAIHFPYLTSQVYYTPSANIAVGYRF